MGTGILVKPMPENLVIPLLEPYGILPDQIIGIAYDGGEFQDLQASKYKDFSVAFFGVSADKGLPTRLILGWETDREFDVWHIIMYWQDVYEASIEASWSPTEKDFIVTMKLGLLETVNQKASKYLTDGLALLLWIQERLSNAGRPKGSGYFASESDFLSALEDVLSKIKKPSAPKTLHLLSHHELWKKEPLTVQESRTKTKTLSRWLKRCGLTWKEALERFHRSNRGGK